MAGYGELVLFYGVQSTVYPDFNGASVLLFLPFSETFLTHMQMGNTYMWHLLLICFIFGLFLRLSENAAAQEGAKNKYQKAKKTAMLFCYFLLSLICGLSGVRYLLALQVPLVLTAAVIAEKYDFQTYEVTNFISVY